MPRAKGSLCPLGAYSSVKMTDEQTSNPVRAMKVAAPPEGQS